MVWLLTKSIGVVVLVLVCLGWLLIALGGRFARQKRSQDQKAISAFTEVSGHQNRTAIAIRVAFRAFGGLPSIDGGAWSISTDLAPKIKLQALRALFVSWVSSIYDGVRPDAKTEAFKALLPLLSELDRAMPDFYNRNIISSDYAVAAWQQNVEAGRRSAAFVESIFKLKIETHQFDKDRSYNTIWDSYSPFGPKGAAELETWRLVSQQALDKDCKLLRHRAATPRQLLLMLLWHDPKSAAFETNILPISRCEPQSNGWPSLVDLWLRERKDGSLVMGQDPPNSAELMVRIANLPASFWESREPQKVLKAFNYCLGGQTDNPAWGSETHDFL